ncbi:MAG: autotransporter-associated beta strand repeat-containing protein [Planctomycetia bacterium]|nr:autotransporter-associated beta strand repeat-containing protein [Planctomycetia bacterium]
MYTHTSQTRRSITLFSAGAAAALLLTGLGISNVMATAVTLTWDPGQSASGGTDGNGTWNTTNTNWYDSTSSTNPVAWADGSEAVFGIGGTGSYTVNLKADVTTAAGSNTSPGVGLEILGAAGSPANYTIDGTASSGTYTLDAPGQFFQEYGSSLTLQNMTLDNSAYQVNNGTNGAESGVFRNSTLNVGNNAIFKAYSIAAGGSDPLGSSTGTTGTINIQSGGTLISALRIQIDFGAAPQGAGSHGTINVLTGGTLSTAASIWLTDVGAANPNNPDPTGTVNVEGGTVNAGQITSAYNNVAQTGILNIDSGLVNATNTAGSITTSSNATTQVNLNGGVLSVYNIENGSGGSLTLTFNGGTLQENGGSSFNKGIIFTNSGGGSVNAIVNGGGATIDTNGSTGVYVYVPLSGGTGSGGLTIENTKGGSGMVALAGGANTYTGPTVVDSGITLQLVGHGSPVTAATIADSTLQLASGATFNPQPDITAGSSGMNLSLGGLALTGGSTIDLALTSTASQKLTLASAATLGGTNTINMILSLNPTSLTLGQYTLISAPGGLNSGLFDFSNGLTTENLPIGSNNYLLSLGNSATAETLSISAVPEPATLGLLALSSLGLLLLRRRRDIGRIV